MSPDPHDPLDDRAAGLAMLGSVVFCTLTGAGIGVFLEQPDVGALAGAAAGIVFGLLVVPGLRRK